METVEVKGREVSCRLSVLLARSAPDAVVLRRGPTRWVQLLRWRTDCDRFEPGQWFKGRVYDRRSDLSPDGSLLIYFASKFNGRTLADREYTYAWTAVSRPPHFTALRRGRRGTAGTAAGCSSALGASGSITSQKLQSPTRSIGRSSSKWSLTPRPAVRIGQSGRGAWSATAGCSCRKEPFVPQGTAGGPSGPKSGGGETRPAPSYFDEARTPSPSGISAVRTWSRFGSC